MPYFNLEQIYNELKEAKTTELDLSSYTLLDEKGEFVCEKIFEENCHGYDFSHLVLRMLSDERMASGVNNDNSIKIWDLKTGQSTLTLEGHNKSVSVLTVLPDDQLASGSQDETIKIWNLKTGQCEQMLKVYSGGINATAVLADGRLASCSNGDRLIKIWNIKTGQCEQTLKSHGEEAIDALAVLPDGRLASVSNQKGSSYASTYFTIHLWNISIGKCEQTLNYRDDAGSIKALVSLPDGRLVVKGDYGRMRVCDLKTHKCQSYWASAFVPLPTGQGVTASSDHLLRVINLTTGQCERVWDVGSDIVGLAVRDDQIVTASGSRGSSWNRISFKIWNTRVPRCLNFADIQPVLEILPNYKRIQQLNLQKLILHDNDIEMLGKYLSAAPHITQLDISHTFISSTGVKALQATLSRISIKHNIFLPSDFSSQALVNQLKESKQTELDFSHYRVLDEKPQLVCQKKFEMQGSIKKFVILPDERLLVLTCINEFPVMKIWNLKLGQCEQIPCDGLASSSTYACGVLPDGRVVVSNQKIIQVWNIKTRQCEQTLSDSDTESKDIYALQVLPDGRVVSGSYDGIIKIWKVSTGQCEQTLKGHTSIITQLVVLPDGRLVSSSVDKTIKVWKIKTGQCEQTLNGNSDAYGMALAVLPDGRLASGSLDFVKVWNLKTGQCEQLLNISPLAISGAGQAIAIDRTSSSREATSQLGNIKKEAAIQLWDIKTEQCVQQFSAHDNAQALFLPNGQCVLWVSDGYGQKNPRLEIWGLCTERPLCFTDIVPVLKVLPNYETIQQLNFQQLNLTDEDLSGTWRPSHTTGMNYYLSIARHLLQIDLRGTQVSADGAKALYTALNNMVSIQYNEGYLPAQKPAVVSTPQLSVTITPAIKPVDEVKQTPQNEEEKQINKKNIPVNPPEIKTLNEQKTPSTPIQVSSPSTPLANPPKKEEKKTEVSKLRVIDYHELELGQELGQGGYGTVYQATWRFQTVAVKKLMSQKLSIDAFNEFKAEAQMMLQLAFPNIVQFYGYCESPKYCLVMEYMPKGSLYSVLHSGQSLEWSIRYQIATDIACGLAFLHQENILHRDIKSLNVLLSDTYRAKLADFGLSKLKQETQSISSSQNVVGTVAWMAPELFEEDPSHTKKADIYGMGITFWEIATGETPFKKIRPAVLPSKILNGTRENIPQDCPKKFASLIRFCWEGNPDKRPEAKNIVQYLKSSSEDFETFTVHSASSNTLQAETKASSNQTPTSIQSTSSAPHYHSNLLSEQATQSLRK